MDDDRKEVPAARPGDVCPTCGGARRQTWVENGEVKDRPCGACHGTGRVPMKTTK